MPETIVLLHGFSGTSRAWDGVAARLDPERYRPLALDLPGHGDRAGAKGMGGTMSFAACAELVLAQAPEHFTLCGYSLGGRVALHLALAAPERVRRVALVSTSPGIEDPAERAARREADELLAQRLEAEPFERFIAAWRSQPLFADDPPYVAAHASALMRRNEPRSLAAAMRGLGAGAMEPLWGRLGELAMPVELLAGRRDADYVAIARRALEAIPDGRLTVLEGGHALPLENPDGVARVLQQPGRLDPEPGA
ncbi:MAG TPA: alpha/beta fold hydrolase [Solirubrobacteraceae bacterium]